MKRSSVAGAVLAASSCTFCAFAQDPPPTGGANTPSNTTTTTAAKSAAIADGVSTYLALSAGASEFNPFINTSPPGLILLTGLKLGLVDAVEGSDIENGGKEKTLRGLSAVWGGASVNNLLIALSAAPPLAVISGLMSGWYLWSRNEAQDPPPTPVETVAIAE
jgi:hypothetical protein